MKKTTKGAIAAGGAAVMLMGGAGTLAFWTSTGSLSGGAITAGNLAITAPVCGTWTYDTGEQVSGATYVPGGTGHNSKLVPGDVISRTCTTTLTATGEHMRGTISASTPAAIAPFVVGVGSITDATTALSPGQIFTEANDTDSLSITVTVTLPSTVTDNQTTSLNLDAITLTATQVHS